MARYSWVQHPETGKLIPKDEYVRPNAPKSNLYVQADIEPFVSPLDGSVITGRRGRDEHCRRHGVVPAQEFDKGHFDRKAAERADVYQGTEKTAHGRQIKQERRQDLKRMYEQLEKR